MSGAGLEPTTPEFERDKRVHALGSAATLIGIVSNHVRINTKNGYPLLHTRTAVEEGASSFLHFCSNALIIMGRLLQMICNIE
jgi:hypothetical protein